LTGPSSDRHPLELPPTNYGWTDYPVRFGCLLDARRWAQDFFRWYNAEHHHNSSSLLTPADVHFGRSQAVLAQRQLVLAAAYQ